MNLLILDGIVGESGIRSRPFSATHCDIINITYGL